MYARLCVKYLHHAFNTNLADRSRRSHRHAPRPPPDQSGISEVSSGDIHPLRIPFEGDAIFDMAFDLPLPDLTSVQAQVDLGFPAWRREEAHAGKYFDLLARHDECRNRNSFTHTTCRKLASASSRGICCTSSSSSDFPSSKSTKGHAHRNACAW